MAAVALGLGPILHGTHARPLLQVNRLLAGQLNASAQDVVGMTMKAISPARRHDSTDRKTIEGNAPTLVVETRRLSAIFGNHDGTK